MDNRNISLNRNGHGRPEMVISSHAEEKMSLQQSNILYQHTSRTVRFTCRVEPLMILIIHFSSSHQMDPLSDVWMSGRSQGNMWGWIHTFDFYHQLFFLFINFLFADFFLFVLCVEEAREICDDGFTPCLYLSLVTEMFVVFITDISKHHHHQRCCTFSRCCTLFA